MSITGDAMFIGLLFMGFFFMLLSSKRRNILVAMVTFLVWFSLGLWLFFSPTAPIGFGEVWQDMLGWSFLVLSFLPWLFQMDVEIKHEKDGYSYSSWGGEPRESGPTEYEAYRDKLYNRTRKNRRR